MFDRHRARVQEDQQNDQPEPPLLLAHPTNRDARSSDAGRELALGSYNKELNDVCLTYILKE